MKERRKKRHRSDPWSRALQRFAKQSVLMNLLKENPGFRYVVLGMIVAVVLVGFYLAPILNMAPKHLGVARTSLYQTTQVRQLKGAALQAIEAGMGQQAEYQIISALRRNPYHLELHRLLITNAMAQGALSQKKIMQLASRGQRLLELSQTNRADLSLVLQFQQQYGLQAQAIALLRSMENPEPSEVLQLLELLFQEEELAAYLEVRQQLATPGLESLPTIPLYDAAVTMLVSGQSEDLEALGQRIKSYLDLDDDSGVSARMLWFECVTRLAQADASSEALKALQARQEDQPIQHARHWRMLHQLGFHQQAKAQALQYWTRLMGFQPANLHELRVISDAFQTLGLNDQAVEWVKKNEDHFALDAEYWVALGHLSLKAALWEETGALAVGLRSQRSGLSGIKPFSFLLEALVQAQQGRISGAKASFDKLMEQTPLSIPSMVAAMSTILLESDQGSWALSFLRAHETLMSEDDRYVSLLYQAAIKSQNEAELRRAHESLLQERSNQTEVAWRELEFAVLTTEGLKEAMAGWQAVSDNQAAVRTAQEARAKVILATAAILLNPSESSLPWPEAAQLPALDAVHLALYHLGTSEAMWRAGKVAEASKSLRELDRTQLFEAHRIRAKALESQIEEVP